MEPVAMIGIFSVGTPERQDDMIAAIDTTGAVMRNQSGSRGAAVYASTDGTRVVNISPKGGSLHLHDQLTLMVVVRTAGTIAIPVRPSANIFTESDVHV
ncbi:hypothetical protein [Actinoplanes sp. NPDC049265]|uniref:hypothetical protein n=1 Tax=Actinoplanes sp. NPDC049265 TaxID=3363902 RepID=UPI0037191464